MYVNVLYCMLGVVWNFIEIVHSFIGSRCNGGASEYDTNKLYFV